VDRSSWISRYRDEIFAGVLSGLLLALVFPPFPTRYLVVFALVPLFWYFIRLARGEVRDIGSRAVASEDARRKGSYLVKRSLVVGFSFGVAFFLILLYWVSNLIPASSARMPWLLIPGLILLVAYLSCYSALFSVALSFLIRRIGLVALFAAPALWSLTEIARSRGELGFSWGILPYALALYPHTLQGLLVYGPFGLSFLLVLVNLLLSFALFGRTRMGRVVSFTIAIIIAGAHIGWGTWEMNQYDARLEGRERERDIAVVQPNVDLGIKWRPEYRDSVFNEIDRLALEAFARGARVVIFPETAAPVSLSHAHFYRERLKILAMKLGVDILIGYVDHEPAGAGWRAYNSAGLIDSTGKLTDQYNKVNLLPFGERLPYSQYIPALSRLNFGQANFEPGKEQTLFESQVGKFGVLICFESIFSDYTRRYVLNGADFLVNITNDGWFGSRRGPIQHAEMAILRSVENRVTLVRAANTGISMVVDPMGRVRQKIDLDLEGILMDTIDRSSGLSFYCRNGHLIFYIMVLINLAIVMVNPIFWRRM